MLWFVAKLHEVRLSRLCHALRILEVDGVYISTWIKIFWLLLVVVGEHAVTIFIHNWSNWRVPMLCLNEHLALKRFTKSLIHALAVLIETWNDRWLALVVYLHGAALNLISCGVVNARYLQFWLLVLLHKLVEALFRLFNLNCTAPRHVGRLAWLEVRESLVDSGVVLRLCRLPCNLNNDKMSIKVQIWNQVRIETYLAVLASVVDIAIAILTLHIRQRNT